MYTYRAGEAGKADARKGNRLLVILAILLVISLSYIAYNEVGRYLAQGRQEAARLGYDQGVIDSVTMLFEETEDCRVVPIMLGNRTKYVVDVACLQISDEQAETENVLDT